MGEAAGLSLPPGWLFRFCIVAAGIFRGFIPVFGVAYLALEIFGVEMRFIESFACGIGLRLGRHGLFCVIHDH